MTAAARYRCRVLTAALLLCGAAQAAGAATSPGAGAQQAPADPCDGLFALVSRPTITTSTCVVKPHTGLVEFGYLNAIVTGTGNASTIPTAAVRTGIARNVEADFSLPSFQRSSAQPPAAGFGDTAGGLKVQFATAASTINAIHVFFTAATGARAFTGGSGGVTASYDVSYALSPKFGLAGTLGCNASALTDLTGTARRFSSLNPSIVVSNSFQKALQTYLELYGATVSGPGQSGRYCLDGGVQADVSRNVQVDASLGTACINIAGASAHYVNVGGAFRF